MNEAQCNELKTRLEKYSCPEPMSGCILWTGAVNSGGYGSLNIEGHTVTASRVAWTVYVGEIPTGSHVLHTCDVRCCVNYRHLFLGSNADNVRDKAAKGRVVKSRSGLPYGVAHSGMRFQAQVGIQINGLRKNYYLGTYATAAEASDVAIEFRTRLWPTSK